MSDKLNKRDISILIGNSLDHFDTSLYGFLAPILAPIFFPTADPIVQLILAYSILATSIFTRPLGTFIFGMIARKSGAITALSYSLIGVAITTIAIGCIPSFEIIGWAAPIVLTLIRMIRGIFSAGEITIAKLYIIENKPGLLAFKASYLYQTSTIFGIILASSISWLVISFEYYELWRLCFWLGGLTGFVGYYLRRTYKDSKVAIKETDSLNCYSMGQSVSKLHNMPALKLMLNNKINILRVAIITSFSYVTYSIPFIVMNNFIPLITEVSLKKMMAFNTNLLVFDMILIPIIGHLIQKFSPRKIMLISCFILLISVLPLWFFLSYSSIWYVTFVRCWIVIWGVIFMIPVNIWYKKLFDSRDQYLLAGIGNSLGTGIIGHMAPTICFSLWYLTNSSLSIALFIATISLLTFYAIFTVKE